MASIAKSNAVPLRMLVIEDDPDTAQTFKRLLQNMGHQVESALDGLDGLRAAEKLHPDVVLLDLGLPDMSGFDVALRMRQLRMEPRPVLIAITGLGEDDERLRSYQAGVDLHLVKPVALGELKTFLDRLLAVRARLS